MDSTTLFTFLLKTAPEVRVVELLGSWDNFQTPYLLHREPLKGDGNWTGCFRFERIVFDGDRPDWVKPRTGGLKQGGRYWYYYRLDDEEEFCDSCQPRSADCPLLPGQRVNVLDVPTEVIQPPSRSRSASANFASMTAPNMTYDPEDRFKKIYRKPPTKLPRFYRSTEALPTDLAAHDTTFASHTHHSHKVSSITPRESCSSSARDESDMDVGRDESAVGLHDQLLSVINFTQRLPPSPSLTRSSLDLDNRDSPKKYPEPRAFGQSVASIDLSRPSTRHGTSSSISASVNSFHDALSRVPFHAGYGSPSIEQVSRTASPMSFSDRFDHGDDGTASNHGQYHGLGIANSESGVAHHQGQASTTKPNSARSSYRANSPHPRHHQLPDRMSSWRASNELDYTITGFSAASPQFESTGSDMSSPTFTADTLSSAGFNSPYRLSIQSPRHAHVDTTEDHYTKHHESLADVASRLDSLNTNDMDEPSYTHSYTHQSHRPSYFLEEATSSDLTLKKQPTPQTQKTPSQPQPRIYTADSPLLPMIGLQSGNNHTETSLTDEIFGELGYLRNAIS